MVTDILQPTHLLFILVVALLVLGPKRLPEVARTLGNGLRDFRSAISGDDDERPGRPGHYALLEEDDPHPAPTQPSAAEPAPAPTPTPEVSQTAPAPPTEAAPASRADAATAVHEPNAPTEGQRVPTEPSPAHTEAPPQTGAAPAPAEHVPTPPEHAAAPTHEPSGSPPA